MRDLLFKRPGLCTEDYYFLEIAKFFFKPKQTNKQQELPEYFFSSLKGKVYSAGTGESSRCVGGGITFI